MTETDREAPRADFGSDTAPEEAAAVQRPGEETDCNAPTPIKQSIEFTGNAGEYFGIWIVNLTLSIMTLGIYSAWAKVRRETYFKSNTRIADSAFGYHATGVQILKGRLLAVAFFVGLFIVSFFQPLLGAMMAIALIFVMPWAINSSLRFSARMTSYRNVHFNWHGTYWETFWFLIIAPLLGVLTLGLLIPLVSRPYYSYFARSHSYGTSKFSCELTVREFYPAFLLGAALPTALISTAAFVLFLLWQGFGGDAGFDALSAALKTLPVAFYAFTFSISYIYGAWGTKLMIKGLALTDAVDFDSTLSPARYAWILSSNLVAVICSLGLLQPWAAVRMYRYFADCTHIEISGGLEKFVDESDAARSSFGEAYADFEGLDVSI
ncbi:MAG: DUF898 domain-containing protein [Gammaproteobacteria bacterium AqS3]|nr:DUF898 domain-containing protein [Gammaproteobacteria bacterium AqS3]